MLLHVTEWGPKAPNRIVCVHGVTQNAEIFQALGERLAADGHSVLAVDLRGHGRSDVDPPWIAETHCSDIIETLEANGVERATTMIGHSYGGRVVATLALREPQLLDALALLETPRQVSAKLALRAIEIERLDWSFATVDGAIQALLASEMMTAPPRDVIAEYVRKNLVLGKDNRYRFRFSPGAAVAAWNEMVLPPPAIAQKPTLVVSAVHPLVDVKRSEYEAELGEGLMWVSVPNGHNVLWEAPHETSQAIETFVERLGKGALQWALR